MNDLPEPMTPPECDLRGYDFMPLFGHRLFGSEFYARASDGAFRAAIKLWWTSWQQCPAGSLPDDDVALCRFADLGRDLKAWRAIREQAMHGFVRCSDGRLYHKLICEEAVAAYDRRIRERDRKRKMRAAKSGPDSDSPEDVPRDKPRTGQGLCGGRAADVRSDRTGQDRTGQDREERTPKPPDRQPSRSALSLCDSETDFDAFWGSVSPESGKGAGPKSLENCGFKHPPGGIVLAVQAAQWPPDPRFVPHPATWLNGERWLDEPLKPRDPHAELLAVLFNPTLEMLQ